MIRKIILYNNEVEYARSHEGRPLSYVVLTSPATPAIGIPAPSSAGSVLP